MKNNQRAGSRFDGATQSLKLFTMLILAILFSHGVAQSQIVINEIRSDGGSSFTVEIKNQGASMVNIGGYFLCHWPNYDPLLSLDVECGSLNLPAGEIVVVSGFIGGSAADGELGLYINGSFGSASSIRDYVEWGSTGHVRSTVAQSAGIWTNGDFVPGFLSGESLEYKGSGNTSADWELEANLQSICEENPAGENCTLNAGTISTTDPTTTCAGDGNADIINVSVAGELGNNTTWLITDSDSNILDVPAMPPFDFEGAGPGVCRIWHVIHNGPLEGAIAGNHVDDLVGCFELSNSLAITRIEIAGGTISTTDPTTFCVGDNIGDTVHVTVVDTIGQNSMWVITDAALNIIATAENPPFEFDGAGGGSCVIWHISYLDGLTGLALDENLADLDGCYHLSNSIEVTRNQPDGGEISTTDATILCLSDPGIDTIHIDLANAVGTDGIYVVTDDTARTILAISEEPVFAFDVEAGVCLIWHISHYGALVGLDVGLDLDDVQGCYDLSNTISVVRNDPDGGVISTTASATYCLDVDDLDTLTFTVSGASGNEMIFVVTEEIDGIVILSDTSAISFGALDPGNYTVYHMSYVDGLNGLNVFDPIDDIEGCFDLSNGIDIDLFRPEGGSISTEDDTVICFKDIDSAVVDVSSIDEDAGITRYLLTSISGEILEITQESSFVFANIDGVCRIWHLGYEEGLVGLEVGLNIADLDGCFDFSNSITITKNNPDGGIISTEDVLFYCNGEVIVDSVDVDLIDNVGANSAWMIADFDGNIVGLPDAPPFSFESFGGGVYAIFHISYADGLTGLMLGGTTVGLMGCWDVSNPILMTIGEPNGGMLSTTDPTDICVGDGVADLVDVSVSNTVGNNSAWVITDDAQNILDLPENPPFDFEDAGAGICHIYHISFEGTVAGLESGLSINDLDGCFDLSDSIVIQRTAIDGGLLTTTDNISICVDTIPDPINTLLADTDGANSQYVITDTFGMILALPAGPPFDLNGAGAGVCQIWHLSYEDGLTGLTVANNVADLAGCFDFSNPLTVDRNSPPDPSIIMLTDSTFLTEICAGDGVPDPFDVMIEEGTGQQTLWMITDASGNILGLPPGPPFDLEGAGAGVCFVSQINYQGSLGGAVVGLNSSNLLGCFAISNSIVVNRIGVNGGELSTADDTHICAGDGLPDIVNVSVENEVGENTAWIITNNSDVILDLPAGPPFDFDGAGEGICRIYHIAYSGTLTGLEADLNINDIEGCHDLSDALQITRDTSGAVCENVGVLNSIHGLVSIDLFPNPSSDRLNLNVRFTSYHENIEVSIVNVHGETMMSKSYMTQQVVNEVFDLQTLAEGQYFLKLKTNRGALVRSFTRVK